MAGSFQRLEDSLLLDTEHTVVIESPLQSFVVVDNSGDTLLGCVALNDARQRLDNSGDIYLINHGAKIEGKIIKYSV
jgi:hypothetical protein